MMSENIETHRDISGTMLIGKKSLRRSRSRLHSTGKLLSSRRHVSKGLLATWVSNGRENYAPSPHNKGFRPVHWTHLCLIALWRSFAPISIGSVVTEAFRLAHQFTTGVQNLLRKPSDHLWRCSRCALRLKTAILSFH